MGPPIFPAMTRQGRHRQPRLRTGGPPGVSLNPADDAEVPRTPTPGKRPGSPPGSSLRTSEEDNLASTGWKLVEDLGAKRMEAPRGAEAEKLSVSVRPPWKRWAPSLGLIEFGANCWVESCCLLIFEFMILIQVAVRPTELPTALFGNVLLRGILGFRYYGYALDLGCCRFG